MRIFSSLLKPPHVCISTNLRRAESAWLKKLILKKTGCLPVSKQPAKLLPLFETPARHRRGLPATGVACPPQARPYFVPLPFSIPQRLARLQHVGHPVLAQLFAAQAYKGFPFDIQQILFGNGSYRIGLFAAGEHPGQFFAD